MNILTKRIPSILGLIILAAGLAAGVFLVRQKQQLSPQAAASLGPQNVAFSNISDRSFTVTWTTSAPASGRLLVTPAGQPAVWFNDQINNATTHAVVVDNLRPNTQYEFRLQSDDNLFDLQGKPFAITTGPSLSTSPPVSDVAQGVVKTAAGDPASGVIIYAQLPSGQLLSSISADSGNWLLPLSVSRTADLSAWLTYDRSVATYSILAQAGAAGGTAEVIVTTSIDQPVPPIILGRNYDFRQATGDKQQATSGPTTTPAVEMGSSLRSMFNFEDLGAVTLAAEDVTLLNPSEESERISTSRPKFFGEGPRETQVNITIESPETVRGNVMVDDDGKWSFALPSDLTPGKHTVTLTWTDRAGRLQTLKRSFVVQAASGEPAFTASPSAVPTKKLTPTPTLSVKKTVPATTSGTPKSGGLTPSVMLVMMGILLIMSGFRYARSTSNSKY